MNEQHSEEKKHFRIHPRIINMMILLSLLIIGFFLLSEHRAHFLGVLPYLLLLACPILHLFMHHGHKHKHHEEDQKNKGDNYAS